MINRKETAWKKSRKFGDVKGGRMRPKLADNIFNRKHNFLPLTDGQEKPIFMSENPSRSFYFPVTIGEIKKAISKLPIEQTEYLTHIWLRRIKKEDYQNNIQGCFICGSGVRLIILYPFPIDLKMRFSKKPDNKQLKQYQTYTNILKQDKKGWYLQWSEENIKKYYIESLLLHEIGHSIDSLYKRFWSKTYKNKAENFANNYAVFWSNEVKEVFE